MCLSPGSRAGNSKPRGLPKSRRRYGESSQACWRAASLPLPISSYPKYFHLSSSPHPSSWYASPVCWPGMWGAVGLLLVLWGVIECEDGGTDPRTNPDLCFPSQFYRGTEEREGGFGT